MTNVANALHKLFQNPATVVLTVAITLAIVALAAFAFIKPLKVLFPQSVGVHCIDNRICIEKVQRIELARKLYQQAMTTVEARLGAFKNPPRIIFCSTHECFRYFGFNRAAARTIGTFGIVIAPRGWLPHYLRHEMIHHWQAENFGNLNTWIAPAWITEGMAYAISEDPRSELEIPYQQYRANFLKTYGALEGPELIGSLQHHFTLF